MKILPLDVPGLLRQYGLRPDKSLGQNFLISDSALQTIVDVSGVTPVDVVLEIGPGLGSLTRYLAARASQVVAVELDQDLLTPLQQVLSAFTNVHIIHGDMLKLDPGQLVDLAGKAGQPYLVVANIPYYITSSLIRHLLEAGSHPDRIILTVQREVAKRISAAPGDLSLLALSVQVYGQPKIAAAIPAGAFYPVPEVDSAVIRVDLYAEPRIPAGLLDTFSDWRRPALARSARPYATACLPGWPGRPPKPSSCSNAPASIRCAGQKPFQ